MEITTASVYDRAAREAGPVPNHDTVCALIAVLRDPQASNEEKIEAREQLVVPNLRLVRHIAKQFRKTGMSYDDLLSAGALGLQRAVDAFDPTLQVTFGYYAGLWIEAKVRECVGDNARFVRVPPDTYFRVSKLESAMLALKDRLGRAPTKEELADELDWPMTKVRQASAALVVAESSRNAGPMPEMEGRDGDVIDAVHQNEQREYLETLLSKLPNGANGRHATIIRERCCRQPAATLEEVSMGLGLSKQRVQFLQAEATDMLRAVAAGKLPGTARKGRPARRVRHGGE